jgi:hypothetical protein
MRDDQTMRTTLDIDDDVLQAAKEIAVSRATTAGKIISELARKGLAPPKQKVRIRNGVPLLPPRDAGSPPLTLEFINSLRDEDPYY